MKTPILASLVPGVALVMLAVATASAAAIAINRASDLSFGALVIGTTGGAVTVSPQGTRTSTGAVVLASSTTVSVSSFVVTGDAYQTFSITLPGSVTVSGGSGSMSVDTFKSDPDGTGILSASGSETLDVGATLHVDAHQPSGSYSGTFGVTVAYN